MEELCCCWRERSGESGEEKARAERYRECRLGPLIEISGVTDDERLADAQSLDKVDECNKRQSERNQAEVPWHQEPRQDGDRDQRKQAAAEVGPVRPQHGTYRLRPDASCHCGAHGPTAVPALDIDSPDRDGIAGREQQTARPRRRPLAPVPGDSVPRPKISGSESLHSKILAATTSRADGGREFPQRFLSK